MVTSLSEMKFELYDLLNDPEESNDIANLNQDLLESMKNEYLEWNETVNLSVLGQDYAEKIVFEKPKSHFSWFDNDYKNYINEFIKRPEYKNRIKEGLKK